MGLLVYFVHNVNVRTNMILYHVRIFADVRVTPGGIVDKGEWQDFCSSRVGLSAVGSSLVVDTCILGAFRPSPGFSFVPG